MNRYYQILSKTRFVILLALLVILSLAGQSQVSAQTPISFQQGTLTGITGLGNPTTLQFGPDNRLYVADRYGTIFALSVQRDGPGTYSVSAQENIELIWQDIPNRTDTGEIDTSSGFVMNNRQITGLVVAGTAGNPVIYVSSSDPREGGGGGGEDTGLDTNSGVVSRLTWNGASWDHLQLVRGLPRSEENHAVNGLELDVANNILYLAVGGFTNMGAPSFNFTYIGEYAYSAAILSIDLTAIGNTTYDLPTLDDPTRVNLPDGSDPNDPFGGNDGLNQARIEIGSPVQVYASGLRNPYDLVLTESGDMYSIDNGPNYNWGGPPVNENPGQCDETINENNSTTHQDNLHFITAGFYGGHPAPVRGNPQGLYPNEADSPVPYALANPIECDYREPGVDDGALATWVTSTNGMAEYTATNFLGEMQGDLLTVSYDGGVYRIKPDGVGGLVDLTPADPGDWGYESLFTGFGIVPLDVTAQSDTDVFPGTIWVAVFVSKTIVVFEPTDFPCTGNYDNTIDEDGDGFDNADEIDNGTNPCSNGSKPADNDGDFESDLNDPDDDNDGIPDLSDFFQIDPQNGVQTTLPVIYDFFNDAPGTGFFGVGFTGLMVNYTTDYLDMTELAELTVGGTAGKATVDNLTEGTAYGATNTQDYAFQWGVNVTSATGTFGINAQLNNPFFSPSPEAGDEQGIYFGNGDQDNYVEVALTANEGTGVIGFEVIAEESAVPTRTFYPVPGATASTKINLYMSIDPVAGTVQPKYSLDGAAYVDLGSPIVLTGSLLNVVQTNQVMAVGLIGHSGSGSASTTGATWDYVFIQTEQPGILDATPDPVAYGDVVATTFLDQIVTIQNLGQIGDQSINVTDMSISGSADFVITSDPSPVILAPGETASVTVRYSPPVVGSDTGTLVINHDGVNTPVNVVLNGNGIVDFDPIYRVNVGGAVLTDPGGILNWSADDGTNPSPYANHATSGVNLTSTGATIDYSSLTLPSYTPANLFNTGRWDTSNGYTNEMTYDFPVINGTYEVRVYFAETYAGTAAVGARIWDVELEGAVPANFNDVDKYALSGFEAGYMLAAEADVTDGSLTVRFLHQVENPEIQGIEIYPVLIAPTSDLAVSSPSLDYVNVAVGIGSDQILTLTNTGALSDPAITINNISYSGVDATDFSDNLTTPFILQPGDSVDVTVTATVVSAGSKTATLSIDHDGGNTPNDVTLTAVAYENGALALSPDPLDFGQVDLGLSSTLTLTLSNLGSVTDADIEVTNLVVTGADTYQFQFEPYANPLIVPAGQSITVDVTFTPAQVGIFPIGISAAHDGVNSPVSISASGEGVQPSASVLYRVNVGGATLVDPAGILNWESDDGGSPSAYYVAGGGGFGGTGNAVDISSATIPVDTPMALFQTERWDAGGGSELNYEFPVANGTYEVRIYVAELYSGITGVGQRIFDAELEGTVLATLDNIDPFALAGFEAGYMVSAEVTVIDNNLTLRFLHQTENPAIKGIEIVETSTTPPALLDSIPVSNDFGAVQVGNNVASGITLSHVGTAGSPSLTITGVSFDDAAFTSDFVGPVALNQGDSSLVNVTFAPTAGGSYASNMTVTHDGANSPIIIALAGFGSQSGALEQDVSSIDFGDVVLNSTANGAVTLTNLGTPALDAAGTAFIESGGILVVEAEAVPLAGDWDVSTNTLNPVAGASGTYYEYLGPDQASAVDPTDNLVYPIEITTPGLYRLQLRSQAEPGQPQSSHNDSWVQITGTGANAVAYLGGYDGGLPDTVMGNNFFKVWMQSPDNFTWATYHVDGAGQFVYVDFTQAGYYDVVISGRSQLHKIDRFALYLESSYNETQLTSYPATPLTPGPGTGSAITVNSLGISGIDAADFAHSMSLPLVIEPGTSLAVDLSFTPTTLGAKTASLAIVGDNINGNLDVILAGNGVDIVSGPAYRVNVGGGTITDPAGIMDWESDNGASPSASYVIGGTGFSGTGSTIDITDPSIPANTPMALFQTERWDGNDGDANELAYDFAVINGTYEVRVYVAEIYGGISAAGQRVFDAEVEGIVPAGFNDIDPYGLIGYEAGYMVSEQVDVSDGNLTLRFLHQTENPAVKAIEIIAISASPTAILGTNPANYDFGTVQVSANAQQAITLSNEGTGGAPALTITNISFGDAAFSSDFVGPIVLNEGESTIINVTFAPTVAGAYAIDLTVAHDGNNAPTTIALTGTGSQAGLLGQDVTALDFGDVVVSITGNGTVTVSNLGTTGDPAINITALNFSGTDALDFAHTETLPLAVAAGTSEILDLTFLPTVIGAESALLTIVSDSTGGDLTVNLTGNGVDVPTGLAYRINVGGNTVTDPAGIMDWESDTSAVPSAYYVAGGASFSSTANAINITDPSIPANTPMALFQTDRWDGNGGNELSYEFPVANGTYEVHIYVAEIYNGISAAGQRVFDAQLEGAIPAIFNDIDPFALAGYEAGYMISAQVTVSDGGLSLTFLHQVENPAIKAIEIVAMGSSPMAILGTNPASYDFGAVQVSANAQQAITLSNDGTGGAPALTITNISFGDAAFTSDFVGPIVLNEGGSAIINVTFAPTVAGAYATDLTVAHDGNNAPTTIALTGTGSQAGLLGQDVTAFNFGNVLVSTTGNGTVTVSNLGTIGDPAINITALNFSGTDALDFAHTETLPLAVAAGTSEILDLTFSPTVAGAKSALLTIVSDNTGGDLTVNLTGNATTTAPTVSAILRIETGGDIQTSSTYNPSFFIQNTSTGGEEIISVSFDISSALVPDVVYDPVGAAGDSGSRCLFPDGGLATTTGFIYPADLCVDPFSVPYELGYNVISTDFTDFQTGESFLFGVDIDPISTRGTAPPGPDHAASVSGYELLGSVATVEFSDGSTLSTELWRYNTSVTGSVNTARLNTLTAPSIEVLGIPSPPAFVSNLSQTVRVTGPVGANVSLLVSEGEMVEQPGGGYDVDPFELNTILNIAEYTTIIGAGGTVDIPITLLDDELIDGTYGGKNYIIAVIRDTDQTSPLSNRIVLEYDAAALPNILFGANLNHAAQEGQVITITDSVNSSASDASTPTINLAAIDDGTGIAPTWLTIPASVVAGNAVSVDIDALGLIPGVYTATVTGTSTGYTNGTFTVTLTVNDLEITITAPANLATIVGDTVSVSWTSSGGLINDHIHLVLDDLSTPGVEPHIGGLPLNGNYDFTGVAPGNYAVIIEMANTNHIDYQGISDTVTITVQAPSTPSLIFANDVNQAAQEGQVITITDSVNSSASDASTPTIDLAAIDDGTGIAPTWLTIPASVVAGNAVSVDIDALGLIPGVYTATVTGTSTGYTNGTFTVTLTVNDLEITITAPANLAIIVGDTVSVSWTSSGGLINDHIHLVLDDLSTPGIEPHIGGLPLNGNYDFTGVAPGNYAVIIEMANTNHIDYQGISDTVTITVQAPSTPSLTFANDVIWASQEGRTNLIYEFVGTGTSDGSTPQMTSTVIDDATGIGATWAAYESPLTAGGDGLLTIYPSSLIPGIYTATVTGTASGYIDATFTITLTVNDLDVAITAPTNGATVVGDSVTVTWASSGGLIDDHIHVTLDDLSTGAVEPHIETANMNGSYTFTSVAPGNYDVIVEMTNVAHTLYQGISDTVNVTVIPIPGVTFTNNVAVNAQAGQALIINDTVGTGTTDAGTPTINLTAIDDFTETTATWLTIPVNVVAGNPINLSVDVDGLLPGNYTATVTGAASNYADGTFTVSLTVSDVSVTIVQPAQYEKILATTVSVQWSSSAALGNDQVSVTLDNLSTGGVEAPVTGLATNGTYDFTGVATGDYEVIVQVADVNGNPYIGATDSHAITVESPGVLPDTVTTIIAPANAATIANAYQVFQWQPANNATWYYIWMSTPNGPYAEWVNAGQNCTASLCSHSFNTPLGDGVYQWAMMTSNVNGNGSWSAVYDFTVSGGTITPVTILGPGDSPSVNPTFSWTESIGATWYYLWVSGPEGLVTNTWYAAGTVCQSGVCSVAPLLNLSPGTYNVWVQHWGPVYKSGPWTAEHNFNMTASPGTPVLGSPAGVIANTSPTFTWQTVPGATWYYLWLSNTDGTHILDQWYDEAIVCSGSNCSVTPALSLADGYYSWWIQSWGPGYGNGPWSSPGSFQVDTALTNSVTVPLSNNTSVQQRSGSLSEPTVEPTATEAVVVEEVTVEETVTAEPTIEATTTQEAVVEEVVIEETTTAEPTAEATQAAATETTN